MVPQSTKFYLEFQVIGLSAASDPVLAKKNPLIKKIIDKKFNKDYFEKMPCGFSTFFFIKKTFSRKREEIWN